MESNVVDNIKAENNQFSKSKIYWMEKLSGELNKSVFPYDYISDVNRESKYETLQFNVPDELCNRILSLSNKSDFNLYIILVASLSALLYRYSGNNDILLGAPIIKQDVQDELLNTILVIRNKISDSMTFKDLLLQARKSVMDANENMNYPLRRLINNLQLTQDITGSFPLFDVAILLENIHDKSYIEGTNPNLLLAFSKNDTSVNTCVEYNSLVYKSETISGIINNLFNFMISATKNADSKICEINILSNEDKNQICNNFNSTQAFYDKDKSVAQLFSEQVKTSPDNIAVVYMDKRITYSQLNTRVNKLANYLVNNHDITICDTVGIILSPCEEMIIAILAILKIGAAYVPIEKSMPLGRIQKTINGAGIKYALTDTELRSDKIVMLNITETIEHSENESDNFESRATGSDAAYIIFTSGTTGQPKGVVVENSSIANYVSWFTAAAGLKHEDKTMLLSSIAFDLGYTALYSSLLNGCELHIVSKDLYTNPEKLLIYIKTNRISYLKLTPSLFGTIINSDSFNSEYLNNCLRFVVLGGEKIKFADIRKLNTFCPSIQIMNHYGPTECTIGSIAHILTYQDIQAGGTETVIGRPIQNTQVYIMDKNQILLPIGVPGEICIAGDCLSRGYINNEELNKQKFSLVTFIDGKYIRVYRTGDLGKYLRNGNIVFLGRSDDQVKIRGYRIETSEIEDSLLKHKLIKDVAVIAQTEGDGNAYLCAYFVSSEELTIEELREHLCTDLPEYMIPSYFTRINEIQLTPNGKIDLKKLPKPSLGSIEGKDFALPQDETEKSLVKIWQDILEIPSISVNDNFFNMGGDSIKVIRLVNRINKTLSIKIEMNDIYINQSIRGLSEYIKEHGNEQTDSEIIKGTEILKKIKNEILEDKELEAILPADYEDFYPLSPIQEGMIFYSLINPEKPIYHNRSLFMAKFERFDLDLFVKTVKLLMGRHPMLRTTFNIKQFSRPIQIVYKNFEPDITVSDISDFSKNEQELHINRYMQDDMNNRFKFNNELLWRIKIFKLNQTDFCIVKTHHHSITDGWSAACLFTEIINTYSSLLQGKEPQLEPLKSTFKDYLAVNLARGISDGKKEFWKNLLKDYTRNKLPFNFTGRKINNLNRSKIAIKNLGSQLLRDLESEAKKNGVTVKDICTSAYICLMSILTSEKDISAGIVTHDRPLLEDAERIQGCFLNTVPIRIKLDSDGINKLEVLNKVRDFLIIVKKYEVFLGDIVKIVGGGNTKENPIFDTIFNFMDFHVFNDMASDVASGIDTDISIDTASENMTNTLLDLEVNKTLNDFIVHIKYSPDYFEQKNIQTALDIYERILKSFSRDISGNLLTGDLISEEERAETLNNFNDTFMSYPISKTMHALFEEQVEKNPENIALTFNDEHMTYKELNFMANRIARTILDRGIKPGKLVGVAVERGFNLIASLIGVLKSGCAYVPIDPDYPEERKEYIAKNSKLSAVLTDNSYAFSSIETINLNSTDVYSFDGSNLEVEVNSDRLAYVIYTSGSTGQPKGVMIEHHSAVNLITWVNRQFDINENDSLLFITPVCFDLSVYDIFGILASGGRVVIASKEQVQNPKILKRLLKDERITFWDSVPSTMNYLVKDIEESDWEFRQNDLRIVFLSGDWIPVNLYEKIKKYFVSTKVISLGGATEGTVWSIYNPIHQVGKYQTSIPYGKPLGNNFFYILDKNGEIVPDGVAGELYIGGVGVASGYINDVEKTRASFLPNKYLNPAMRDKLRELFSDYEAELFIKSSQMLYKTGDLGRMLPDGDIEFLGRVDHQVKIRGFRVELGEIESRLLKNELVKEAVVVDRTDIYGDKYLCAYIVTDADFKVSDIRGYLMEALPDYMIPAFFVKLDILPLNSNGKLDRKRLPEPDGSIGTGVEFELPQNEIEKRLEAIWKEVLNVDAVSVNDSFFEIGGDSLLLVQVHNKIEKFYMGKIKITDLFLYTTIRSIAGFIEQALENADKIIIQHMKARKEFINTSDRSSMSNSMNFYIKDQFFKKLKSKANNNNVLISDILLSMFVYAVTDLTDENEAIIQAMVTEEDMVTQMSIDLSTVDSFLELLKTVKEYDFNRSDGSYSISDVKTLHTIKGTNHFVPLFYIDDRMQSEINLGEIYDIIVKADIGELGINIEFDYNFKLFGNESMHELLNIYYKLIMSFVDNT